LLLLAPPLLAFLLVYVTSLVALFVSSFWTINPLTTEIQHIWNRRQLPVALGLERLPLRDAAHRRHRRRGHAHRRDPRVPARLLHGAHRRRTLARVHLRGGAAAA